MLNSGRNEYQKRINRVIDYLGNNLDKPVNLETLAKVACFSPFHFHRVFGAMAGETLNNFANRLRLEKAARLLRFSKKMKVTDIALECGFSDSATFSRSFKKMYDTSPTQFRSTGEIQNSKICKDLFSTTPYLLDMTDAGKFYAFPVEIRKFPAWNIAYIRVVNSYEGTRVLDAFKTITDWAKDEHIFDSGTIFGMSIDDPFVTPQHLCRYEVCIATEKTFTVSADISAMKLPARTYAVTRVKGEFNLVATAIDYLFKGWLINSEYEPDHAPGLEIFLDNEAVLDWSSFHLDLCIPIKPINNFT